MENGADQIPDRGFQLGLCHIEPAESKIVSPRGPEHVEPRVMDVLMVLVNKAGHTVSREELIDRVWNTIYVSDEVLSRCISLLRRHLGDDRRQPSYIETVPKRGYRLIASISDISSEDVAREAPSMQSTAYESIAVLPFTNLSDDSEYEYFSDGMAEELLTLLAKASNLRVAARTSAFFFKDQNIDMRLIGERLGVDAVLTGSVRHTGNRIRIAAQLLDTKTGYHIWSELYEKLTSDFYELQVELSNAIVAALKSAMAADAGHDTRAQMVGTTDFYAYQLYLQGKFHLNRRGEDPIRKSIALFDQAGARDGSFTPVDVAMAKAYSVLPFYSGEPMEPCFERARAFASRALELNEREVEAHTVLAFTSMHLWKWADAEREFQRAIRGPSIDPSAHQWYAQFLSMIGEFERSTEQILIAYGIDPVSPAVNERLAFNYLLQDENDLAESQFQSAEDLGMERTATLDPYFLLLWRRRRIDEMATMLEGIQKRLGLGRDWAELMVRILRDPSASKLPLKHLVAERYRRGMPAVFVMTIFAEELDTAFALVNALVDTRQLAIEAVFISEASGFRRDSRFGDLVKKVGLHDYWDSTRWPPVLSKS